MTRDTIQYAQDRANATRRPYVISTMGHVLVHVPRNMRLVNEELGGLYAVIRPRKP